MQTGKLFVRDRNARAIFCIGFFAAQHPVKDVLSCTESRLIVHHIGDNGSLTVKVAVFHKEILRAAVTFNDVFIDVPEFDRSRRSGQHCFMKAHEFHELFIREGIGIKADAGNANLHFAGKVIVNFGDDFLLDPLVCFLNIGSRVKYRELHDVDSLRQTRVISRINAASQRRNRVMQLFHRRNVSGDVQLIVFAVMPDKSHIEGLHQHPLEAEPAKSNRKNDVCGRTFRTIGAGCRNLFQQNLVVLVTVFFLEKSLKNFSGRKRSGHWNRFIQKREECIHVVFLPCVIRHACTLLRELVFPIIGQGLIPAGDTKLVLRDSIRCACDFLEGVFGRLSFCVAIHEAADIPTSQSCLKRKLTLCPGSNGFFNQRCQPLKVGLICAFLIVLL